MPLYNKRKRINAQDCHARASRIADALCNIAVASRARLSPEEIYTAVKRAANAVYVQDLSTWSTDNADKTSLDKT